MEESIKENNVERELSEENDEKIKYKWENNFYIIYMKKGYFSFHLI